MPVYTANFSELLEPHLRVVFDDTDRAWDSVYDKVFEVLDSKKASETDFSTTGFDVAQQYGEGEDVPLDTIYRGWKYVYTHIKFGLGCIITREMYEDDLYRHMKTKPQALARAMNEFVEIMAANVLNRANNASYPGADSVPLAYSAHPTIAGGTWSNVGSADLDVHSIEQAYISIGNFIGERGLKYRCRPIRLIVSPSDEFNARIILNSAQLPGTANNDINPAQNSLPKGYVVWHYLTDPDAWGVQTDAPQGLTFFWRRRKDFTNDTNSNNDNAKFKSTARASCGWTNPRCIYWSTGG